MPFILVKKMLVFWILIIVCLFQVCQVDSARWTPEQAKSWYEGQPLFFGANFGPYRLL